MLLSGNLFIPLRCIINKSCNNGCGLFQILADEVIIAVHIAVMGPGSIFYWILNELETGKADAVEGNVIGAAGVAHRNRRRAEVREREKPCLEDRGGGRIALGIDASDLPAAIVQIEVNRKLVVFRAFREARRRLSDWLAASKTASAMTPINPTLPPPYTSPIPD